MKVILRIILGGVLGFFIGENALALGLYQNPSIFIPMVIWYSLLFLTFDSLITKYSLSDRNFYILASIFGILIGGILDREFFAPSPTMGIFGLDIASTLLNTTWWGASFILLFHLVNTIIPRQKILPGAWIALIFLFLTAISLGQALSTILSTVNPAGVVFLLLMCLVLLIILAKRVNKKNPDERPILEGNMKLNLIPVLFVILATIFAPQGYWIFSFVVVIITLVIISRYRISI